MNEVIIRKSSISLAIFAALISITSLAAVILSRSYAENHAEAISESIIAGATVPLACTMSSGGGTYTATMDTNTKTLTGNAISVNCNDSYGFDLYAVGYSGDKYHTYNTDLIFSGNNSIYNIKTDGTGGASNWKMKINTSGTSNVATIDNNYDDYSNVPSTYTKIAHYSSITSGPSTVIPSYQIYISSTQPKGNYTGKVKYTLVHPSGASAPVTPPAPTPSCDTAVPGVTYLQDINSNNKTTVLNSLIEEAGYYLYDKRDNTPYCVSKLKDGRLWMIDNLALDPTLLTQEELYGTGSDAGKMTNASNTTLGYLKGTTTRNPSTDSGGKYATAGVSYWVPAVYNYSYSEPWIVITEKDNIYGAPSGSLGSNKTGIFYNFCAASAGSYCYGNGSSTGTSIGDATEEDICPYGWRIPTGNSTGEYTVLYGYYSSNYLNFEKALSTPLSGNFSESRVYSQGTSGFYWSSARYSNGNMDILNITANYVNSTRYYEIRSRGNNVRCILK